MDKEWSKGDQILTNILYFVIGGAPYVGMSFLTVLMWRSVSLPAFVMPTNFFGSFTMFIQYVHNPYFWLMDFSLIGSWEFWWFLCKVYKYTFFSEH